MNGYALYVESRRGLALVALMAICCGWVAGAAAQGLDRIQRRNGIDSGRITGMSALDVTIDKSGVATKVPGEEIRSITYADEPASLHTIRQLAGTARYEDALDSLGELTESDVSRKEVQQEVEFLKAFCMGKQALAGQADVDAGAKQVNAFLARYKNSYHVPLVIELSGDLRLASGKHDEARKQYKLLGRPPSAYYKMRSALLVGQAFQDEGRHDEALAQFQTVLDTRGGGPRGDEQRLAAALGKAVSQSASGNDGEATEAVTQIIAEADPENADLLATAYNALGDCYLESGEKKAALFALLHVDLLYSSAVEEHARALYKLTSLWAELGHEDRATDSRQRLVDSYPESRWASQL